MKKYFLSLLFSSLMLMSFAQKEQIAGSWLLTKAETSETSFDLYFVMEYTSNGKLVFMDMEIGSWEYDAQAKAVVTHSDFDREFDGVQKIIRLSDQEMVLQKEQTTMYYTKVDKKSIQEKNVHSHLAGSWYFKPNEQSSSEIRFELPDAFSLIETDAESTTTYRGFWIYDPAEKVVIISSLSSAFKGKNSILNLTDHELVLKTNEKTIRATR